MTNAKLTHRVVTGYWLDAGDKLIRVSDTWDVFAMNNNGQAVISSLVLGKPLW
jgi:hypothetical protein